VCALLFSLSATAQLRTDTFNFHTTGGDSAMATELAESAEKVHKEVAAQLGALDLSTDRITVRIFHGEESFRAAMPHLGSIDWAAGVAFPSQSLILLKIDRNTRFEVHDVFRHEISHVVLHRAAGGKRLPLWFVEGVAVHQAGERLLERWQVTANATLTGDPLPLATLEHGFPADSVRADMAYAQSTAFIAYLLRRHGWGGLRAVVSRVRRGEGFESALNTIYGDPLHRLEADWQRELERSATWLPILTGTTVLWVLITVLFIWSWWVKRSRTRRRMAALDDAVIMLDGEILDDEFA